MGIVVAIDGPSGAGKSSTAKLIAHRAGWNYLDTVRCIAESLG